MSRSIRLLIIILLAIGFCSLAAKGKAEEKRDGTVHAVQPELRTAQPSLKEGSTPQDEVRLITDPAQFPKVHEGSGIQSLPQALIDKLDPDELSRIVRLQMQKPQTLPELMFQENIIVPGIVFTSFAVMAFLFAYYSYRKRRDVIETVQAAIKSGQTLPDSFIEALENKKKPTRETDLRKAVLLIALGISAIIITLAVAPVGQKATAALGILPTLLGFAYLFLWKTSEKKSGTR